MDTTVNILNAAGRLFYLHGIRRITMDNIAAELGISKKTIYDHFEDKTEIVFKLLKRDLEKHKEEFTLIRQKSPDAVVELSSIMRYVCGLYRSINLNFFFDIHKHYHRSWDLFQEFKNEWMVNTIKSNILRGMEQGLYRENIDVNIVSRLRIVQIESLFNTQSYPPDQFDLVEVQKQTLEHFIFGIATIKGHKLFVKQLSLMDPFTFKLL